MNLKTKFFTLMAVVFLAFTAAAWFYSQHLVSQINEMWGARLAEKQVLFDKQRTLRALMREITLSRQMADEPALIEMALHEDDPTTKARGLEVLERYRPKFRDRKVFAAMDKTGHYYYSDAENKYGKPQPLLTLSPTHSDDHWFYKFMDSKLDYAANINPGIHPGTTEVWINAAIRHNNEAVGVIGTGLDITEFIKESIAVEQPGIRNVFIGRDLTIQLHPDSKPVDYRLADRRKVDALLTAADVEHLREVMQRLEKTPEQTATLWVTYEGKKHLLGVAYLPEINWFNLSFMDARTSTLLHDFNFAPVLAMIFLMALSAMGWMLHRLVLEPVARLKTGMDKVALGGLNERIAETGKDELSALAHRFNEMTTRLSETTVSRDALSAEVTERKRAEIELASSEKLYRLLVENMHDVVWILEPSSMRFRYVSPSVEQLLGYTAEEIMARTLDDAMMPDHAAALEQRIRQRMETFPAGSDPGRVYYEEIEQPCKDGSTVWTEVAARYFLNAETGQVEIHGVARHHCPQGHRRTHPPPGTTRPAYRPA